jgi:hypothetical protein
MSVRQNAPYADRLEDDGSTIIYEGHDAPRNSHTRDPKAIDQSEFTPSGHQSDNGRFHRAAQDYKAGIGPPERIRVYEKIRQGIWSYNGVFKFKLVAVEGEEDFSQPIPSKSRVRRVIPTWVKLEVWKRDGGKCASPGCKATSNLHFDHIIPFSRGGASDTPDNIQLLCGRHNIQKGDDIF